MSKRHTALVFDDETGECILSEPIPLYQLGKAKEKVITKALVNKMLEEAGDDITKLDMSMLTRFAFKLGEINIYNQVMVKGTFKNKKTYNDILAFNFGLHILKCLNTCNKYSCFMKKNHKVFIETWNDLWETVEISNRNTQQQVKAFLLNNKLVRIHKHVGRNGEKKVKFVVNPFLFRESSFVSELAVHLFQDHIEEGRNMSTYIIRLLQCKELVDSEYTNHKEDI